MAESSDKVCVLCGQSCAGQPRIKNERGEYAHRACAEKKRAAPTAAKPAALSMGDGDDDLMGALLDDLPASAPAAMATDGSGLRQACPGCGVSLSPGTVVCMSCGFNTRSGKAGKTKVTTAGAGSGAGLAGLAAGAGSAAGSGMTTLIGSVIGASIAGALGAAVWAGISIVTNYEIGYVAIGVGAACGFGAALGARERAGAVSGIIAVLIAVVSILGGKYFAVAHFANEYVATMGDGASLFEQMNPDELRDFAASRYADEIIEARLDAGGLDQAVATEYEQLYEAGLFPEDYPDDLVAEARARWDAMDQPARDEFERASIESMNEMREYFRTTLADRGFVASLGFMDLLFFGIAVIAAFGVGSGGSGND